jgi:hypothetical protein
MAVGFRVGGRRAGQLAGDRAGPRVDLFPVPEVPFGQQTAAGRQPSNRSLGQCQAIRVEGTEEHSVAAGLGRLVQFAEFLR